MAFDEKKDILLKELAFVQNGSRQHISAGIFTYDGGPAKVRIQRKIHTQQGTKTTSIGGMTRKEAEIAQKILTDALALPLETWPTEEGGAS